MSTSPIARTPLDGAPESTSAAMPAPANHQIRSLEMQLLHENLARAHCEYKQAEMQRDMRSLRLGAAYRAQRRAERAVVRARRLVLLAVVR
jgi:hypothetical protein